ncbi:MAG: hypothetical protein MZV63_39585 [Marinilabiliales bacterium]|nr:hypothetical protein [Marinilabiliales bacterium]
MAFDDKKEKHTTKADVRSLSKRPVQHQNRKWLNLQAFDKDIIKLGDVITVDHFSEDDIWLML